MLGLASRSVGFSITTSTADLRTRRQNARIVRGCIVYGIRTFTATRRRCALHLVLELFNVCLRGEDNAVFVQCRRCIRSWISMSPRFGERSDGGKTQPTGSVPPTIVRHVTQRYHTIRYSTACFVVTHKSTLLPETNSSKWEAARV